MGRAKKPRVENLSRKLKEIRESLKLTQADLIKELGLENVIYQGNISEYESGRREPPLPILFKYAQLAGICLDVLADDKEELFDNLPRHKRKCKQS